MLSVCICTYSLLTGERFSPGVGQVNATDEIKREIIHQLSIKPMAHSELVKSLPEDVSTCILRKENYGNPSLPTSLVCIDLLLCIFSIIVKTTVLEYV